MRCKPYSGKLANNPDGVGHIQPFITFLITLGGLPFLPFTLITMIQALPLFLTDNICAPEYEAANDLALAAQFPEATPIIGALFREILFPEKAPNGAAAEMTGSSKNSAMTQESNNFLMTRL